MSAAFRPLKTCSAQRCATRDSVAPLGQWRAMLVLLLSPLQSDLPNDYQKTSPMMQTVGGGVLRSLGRDDPSLGRASVLAPANQRIVSCGGCGRHGNCDMRYGNCSCQMGWGGPHCEQELFPSCRFSPAPPDVVQPGNSLAAMCASLRKLSPVACELSKPPSITQLRKGIDAVHFRQERDRDTTEI